jgi:hypothetical protein
MRETMLRGFKRISDAALPSYFVLRIEHNSDQVPSAKQAHMYLEYFEFPVCCATQPIKAGVSLLYLFGTFKCHLPNTLNSFGMYGGDDGARTRDLCRDRAAL